MISKKLSSIVVTHNEEKNIEECLRTLSWADEVIVVDGQSSDRTIEIVKRYTDEILLKENAPCEIQRLAGIQKASGEWVFFVDADERVSDNLQHQIQEVLQKPCEENGFYVLRKNYLHGRALHIHSPDYQLRLFRKSAIARLPREIHDVPEIQGKMGKLDGELTHLFFPSVKSYFEKINFYTTLEAGYLYEKYGSSLRGGKTFYYGLIKPFARFLQCYFLKNGFRDGFWGFFLSAGSALYDVIAFAKFWFRREKLEAL